MKTIHPHRIRSYVGRNSRITPAQQNALQTDWPAFGLTLHDPKNAEFLLSIQGKLYIEIGFGSGQSLLAAAQQHPLDTFIGIEPHQPGVGSLMISLKRELMTNVKVFCDDAVKVLQDEIADHSVDGFHIFFPDPWQKRKHHERRLIQTEFVDVLCRKLKLGGHVHVATDWQHYADHITRVLESHPLLARQGSERSVFRPLVTKFEMRSIREHRVTTEFQFVRVK